MKRFISIFLAAAVIFSACSTAFANIGECDCGNTPVIYIRGFGETIYENPESEDRTDVFGTIGDTAKNSIPKIILGVLGLLTFNYDLFGKYAIEVADSMLEKLECDKNGVPLYNTGVKAQEEPDFQTHLGNYCEFEGNSVDGVTDRCYYFRYDWRMSPIDNAKLLNEYAAKVMEVTKHNQVSFICHSQGNTIVASYLYLYGSENIDKVAFLSPAYQGVSLISSLFTEEINVRGKADELEYFINSMLGEDSPELTTVIRILNIVNIIDGLLWWLDGVLDSQYDRVFDEYLSDAFGNLAGVWSFVSVEDYEKAKLNKFGENYEETEFTKKIDEYHYNVQKKLVEIIQTAMNNGTEVIICAGYDISSIPVTTSQAEHSDMLINSKHMSIGATFAPVGKTFETGYVQAVNCGHDHVSGDCIVDASTCAFPEITWFFKGMDHNTFPADYIALINKFLSTQEQITVHSFEEYPQFLQPDGEQLITV